MKCKVCGNESGKYPLCRACNLKRENGEIIKCEKCGNWHYITASCDSVPDHTDNDYLYEPKGKLMSKTENDFYQAIKQSVPEGYIVFPQMNLAAFIKRTDNARFHNELFRNVDFLITDSEYMPKTIIEINDNSHLTPERQERDEKVRNICEEAGIPIITFWTKFGVNSDYISSKLKAMLSEPKTERIHHFSKPEEADTAVIIDRKESVINTPPVKAKKKGCYIATCVYGSYDCPSVWVLRRFRDNILDSNIFGRLFILIYYLISPTLVRLFGQRKWFTHPFRIILNRFVSFLEKKGFSNTPYTDT